MRKPCWLLFVQNLLHAWCLCWSNFYHGNNIPEKINLKGERFILVLGFKGFSPWLVGSVVSGPVVRWNLMMGSMWWSRAAHLSVAMKWGWSPSIPSRARQPLLHGELVLIFCRLLNWRKRKAFPRPPGESVLKLRPQPRFVTEL